MKPDSSLSHVLGVDPAMAGGAVLLFPGTTTLCAAWVWKKVSRAGTPAWGVRGVHRASPSEPWKTSRRNVAPFGAVGEYLRESVREMTGGRAYLLASENAVVGRNVATSVIVARNAGRVIGPLEALAVGQEASWVKATEWRSLLLGLHHRTGRDEAKEKSKDWMPTRIQGLPEVRAILGDVDDLTDAAGVAEWETVQSRGASSPPSPKRPPRPRKIRGPSSRSGSASR